MKLMNRFYSLLALLLVGSASLQAQSDPFPDRATPARKYQGSMTCTSQVVMNGEIVTDAVVAAYCGDDFRGKNSTGKDPGHPNHVCLTIYGDHTITKQNIHFKVYMQGKIFTFNPDPAFVYTFNGSVGSAANPYIIDITPVSMANNADNTATLTTWKDKTCDVALTGRTLYKDGDWNTICLPFTLTASEVNEHLENPAGLMTLSSSSFDSTTGTLTMNFADATSIEAGKPYIVKWTTTGEDLVNPVFTGVTISDATENVETDYVDFIGIYSTTVIYEDGADKHNLYLGSSNNLYYPSREGYSLKACRAYFQLKNGLTAGDPTAGVRAFALNFDDDDEPTGIRTLSADGRTSSPSRTGTYTLDGRQVTGQLQPGLYIVNGKKMVIK